MKIAAPVTGFVSAACTSARWLRVTICGAALAAVGCEAKPERPSVPALSHSGGHDGTQPAQAGLPPGHPEVPMRAPDPAASEMAEILAAASARQAASAVPAADWNASCQAHRKCAKEPAPIPNCAPGIVAEEWGQLEYTADKHLGQMIVVEGPLALTPATQLSTAKCAPGVCCHSLNMNVVLDGRPDAVALPGFSCHGDDSAMCCNVPANGQLVNVRGRVQKAPAASGLKFQLADASLCIPVPAQKDEPAPATSMR